MQKMNRISALIVLAVLGLAVAGCGSAQKSGPAPFVTNTVDSNSPSGTIYVTGTKTFTGLKVGTPIACNDGDPMVVNVPSGVTEIADGGRWAKIDGGHSTHSSTPTTIDLTRDANGTVTVSCGRG